MTDSKGRREWYSWLDVDSEFGVANDVATQVVMTRQVPVYGSPAWQEQVLVKFTMDGPACDDSCICAEQEGT